MLLRFRCKNFRSIREEQELSLIATKTRSDERNEVLLATPLKDVQALRCAAIYGANASGKSNVLRAMRVFSRMVSNSQNQWNPTGPIPTWNPFVLDEVSSKGETEFQIDFVIDERVYNYGFRFNATAFLEEWLTDITGKARKLFRRKTEGSTVSVMFPGRNLTATEEDTKHLELIRLQTRPNSLFLSAAAQGNHSLLSGIFKWIVERFHQISPHAPSYPRLYTAEACSKSEIKRRVLTVLKFADFGIVDFSVAETEAPFESALHVFARAMNVKVDLPNLLHDIKMTHRGAEGKLYPLEFDEESDGTRAYFSMLGPILDVLEKGTVVLIDELESSLHPHLAKQIVRIFNDPALNPKGAQLIFATHDTNLLDLELLRRDQIWFTEKNEHGATVLIPLSDFKPRKDQNIASAYLHGRFGAIPFLDESLLRSAVEPAADKATEPVPQAETREP